MSNPHPNELTLKISAPAVAEGIAWDCYRCPVAVQLTHDFPPPENCEWETCQSSSSLWQKFPGDPFRERIAHYVHSDFLTFAIKAFDDRRDASMLLGPKHTMTLAAAAGTDGRAAESEGGDG